LILRWIDTAPEEVAPRFLVLLDARVVTGGDRIRAESGGSISEGRKFHIAVAARAGERRPSGRILLHEIRDDLLVELTLEVENVMRDVDRGRDTARVVQIVDRTAAAERRLPVRLIVELHGYTDH